MRGDEMTLDDALRQAEEASGHMRSTHWLPVSLICAWCRGHVPPRLLDVELDEHGERQPAIAVEP